MFNLILLASLLVTQSQEVPCFDCVKAKGFGGSSAQATITFTLDIVSTHSASININQVDPSLDDVYRVVTNELITGTGYAYNVSNEYLIIDDFKVLEDKNQVVMAMFTESGKIEVNVPQLVLVYNWPDNTSSEEIVEILKNRNVYDIGEVLVRR